MQGESSSASAMICLTIGSLVVYMGLFVYLVVLASRFVKAFELIASSINRIANKEGGESHPSIQDNHQ